MILESKSIQSLYSTKGGIVKTSKESLREIFEDQLKEIFWTENHLAKALPEIAKATYNELLQETFEELVEKTQRQLIRLENCFELLFLKARAKKCYAIEGSVQEVLEVIQKFEPGHARDAALIAAAQKIQHYEISAYGTLRTMATAQRDFSCAKLLELSKEEEVEMVAKLTELAEKINKLAVDMEEEEVD